MRRISIIIAVLMLCICDCMAGGKLKRDSNLRTGRLSNGLTYYIYPNARPRGEAVYRLFVKAGSVQENNDERGLAHFIEHMAFNGTRHFPGDGIVRFLQSKGAKFGKDLNAHTAFTETVYKLQLPTTNAAVVDSTMLILADWAGGVTFAPDEVDRERGVIMSEWRQRGGSSTKASQLLLDELLNGSRYANRMTIGDTAVIQHATAATLRGYYDKWYTPGRMAVAVAGDIDADVIEGLIKRYFSDLKSKDTQWRHVSIPQFGETRAKVSTDSLATSNQLEIVTLCDMPPAVRTADDYRQYLMRALVNRLVKLRFNSLSFSNPAYEKGGIQYASFIGATGVVDASAELQKGKIKEGITDYIDHYRQIEAWGFTSQEIRRVGKALESSLRLKAEGRTGTTSTSIMESIYADYYNGNTYISLGDEYALMRRLLPAMDSVAVLKAVRQILRPAHRHYLLTGNNRDISLDSVSLMALVEEASRRPLLPRYQSDTTMPDELCDVKYSRHIVSETPIPAIAATDLRLDNGTRVIFRHTDAEPDRILLSGFRKGGQYAIDSSLYVTGLVVPPIVSLSGAGDFSRDAISSYLAGNTASVRLLVDKHRTGVAASAHLDDMETMFQLLWLRWTRPRLDANVFKLTMDKLIEADSLRHDTPSKLFTKRVQRVLNGDSYIYDDLTRDRLREVRQDSALSLMRRFYGPAGGYTFIVTSSASLDEVRPFIETYIGGLPSGSVDTLWVTPPRHVVTTDTTLVGPSDDKDRATVTLLFPQYSDSTEYFRRQVLEDMTKSVLRQALLGKLREEMGKVYSVSVSISSTPYPSFMQLGVIAFVCKPDDVDSLIAAARQVVGGLVANPAAYAEAIADVKANLIKDHATQAQRPAWWTTWIRNAIYTGHEQWQRLTDYDGIVNGITAADLAAFARQCFVSVPKVTTISK